MTEDFFMNKNAKKLLEFSPTLFKSGENIVHLLLRYAPFVHPKFVLKRKDLEKSVLDAKDVDGFTPLLRAAEKNNRTAVQRVLASKNVKGMYLFC